MPPLPFPPDRTLIDPSRIHSLTSSLRNHIRSLLSYPPYLPSLSDIIPRQHINPPGGSGGDSDRRPHLYEVATTTSSSSTTISSFPSTTTRAAPTSTFQALVFGPTPTSVPKLSEEQVEGIKDVLEAVTENKERENGFKKAAKAIERLLSQGIPSPNRHQDWHAESDKVVEFLRTSWAYIVWAVCSLFVIMLFLIFLAWLARLYDKRCVTKGKAEWGADIDKRDTRLAVACVRKGRALRENMDAAKAERLKTEEARWWQYVDEAVAEKRRRKGMLARQGAVTSITAAVGESLGRGAGPVILPVSVAEGTVPASNARPGIRNGAIGRNLSKRGVRRGEGTQFFSDEADGVTREESAKGKHRPAGGSEKRVSMLVRSVSGRSVRRARKEEEPAILYGHYHTTRELVNMSGASPRKMKSRQTSRASASRSLTIDNDNPSSDSAKKTGATRTDPLLEDDAAAARHLVKVLSRNPLSYEGARIKPLQRNGVVFEGSAQVAEGARAKSSPSTEVQFEGSGKMVATEPELETGERDETKDELERIPFLAAKASLVRSDSRGRELSAEPHEPYRRESQIKVARAAGIAATEPEINNDDSEELKE